MMQENDFLKSDTLHNLINNVCTDNVKGFTLLYNHKLSYIISLLIFTVTTLKSHTNCNFLLIYSVNFFIPIILRNYTHKIE